MILIKQKRQRVKTLSILRDTKKYNNIAGNKTV